jgi:hypothetical protein
MGGAQSFPDIMGPYVTGQPVVTVIGHPNDFILFPPGDYD